MYAANLMPAGVAEAEATEPIPPVSKRPRRTQTQPSAFDFDPKMFETMMKVQDAPAEEIDHMSAAKALVFGGRYSYSGIVVSLMASVSTMQTFQMSPHICRFRSWISVS